MLKINGQVQNGDVGSTIAEIIVKNGYSKGAIAVELNGNILPKAEYGSTRLSDGDTVEIVCFVGGG